MALAASLLMPTVRPAHAPMSANPRIAAGMKRFMFPSHALPVLALVGLASRRTSRLPALLWKGAEVANERAALLDQLQYLQGFCAQRVRGHGPRMWGEAKERDDFVVEVIWPGCPEVDILAKPLAAYIMILFLEEEDLRALIGLSARGGSASLSQ